MAPADLKYTESHEWVKVEGNIATVGITDFAVEHLGDIVYLELSPADDTATQGVPFGTIESVKAASDLNSPVSGTIKESNEALPDDLDVLKDDPFGRAWMVKVEISDPTQLDNLMDAGKYEEYLKTQD